jgi:hypothetical protein
LLSPACLDTYPFPLDRKRRSRRRVASLIF